ncbi:MAG: sugar transferase [Bacteroidales bacterium]
MKTVKFKTLTLAADFIILAFAFVLMVWIKPASLKSYLPSHFPFFIILSVLWLFLSLFNGKMHHGKIINLRTLFNRVISSNIMALAVAALLMYIFREYSYSRTIVLGTVVIATVLELVTGMAYLSVKKAMLQEPEIKIERKKHIITDETRMVETINIETEAEQVNYEISKELFEEIKKEAGREMAEGIRMMIGNKSGSKHILVSTGTVLNIKSLPGEEYTYLVNLRKINKIKDLNGFLDAINSKLKSGGYFLCCVETKNKRKHKLLKRFPPVLNYIIYLFDFVINRIMPKLRITRRMWLFLTGGEYNIISRAEALGRLCRAGLYINREAFVGENLCIETVKKGKPEEIVNNHYGFFIALNRIGKDGRLIKVYKLRTMHPYSEYIQDYVYSLNNMKEGGKFENDFRVTSWGAFCRKTFLDELPMLINFLKGEMKIVGVRPLSQHYFSLYSKELQERRIRYKPGLIPPFYADLPETLKEIQESEKKYLDAYDKNPLLTDFKYFFCSLWNIIINHARSN